ncbi:MAG: SMC family ATPase, partial [Microbacteriaceae bacterium]|nr:SMC family ATPase [Microbacteriaceae bacterium]
AERLEPGAPCPVCGAAEHPAPADPAARTVTEADLDEAVERARAAATAADAARERVAARRVELAARREAAGGLDADAARAEVDRLADALAAARTAVDESAALRTRIDALEAEAAADAAAIERLEPEREALAATATSAATTASGIETRRDELRGDHPDLAARLAAVEARVAAAERLLEAAEHRHEAARRRDEAAAALDAALAASAFADRATARAAVLADDRRAALEARRDRHREQRAAASAVLAEPELQELPAERIDLAGPRARHDAAAAALEAAQRDRALAESALAAAGRQRDDARAARRKLDRIGPKASAERTLADALRGNNARRLSLEAFVLAASLEEIIAAANGRLDDMTGRRYLLELDDALEANRAQSGLGLAVRDAFTGLARAPESLSGGETFLVSLALALGLADVVSAQAGGLTLDTLFIDEGFGSLDGDTLEVAMRTLDRLRDGGRTIGVISHVASMQERIPARLDVIVTDEGASELRTPKERT